MADEPWITILTPLYTGVEYFRECAESVFRQTNTGWAWSIGINGYEQPAKVLNLVSTILDELHTIYGNRNVKIICYEWKGKEKTMNALVGTVKSPWIAILDCDDYWHENKLDIQYICSLRFPSITGIGTLTYYDEDSKLNDGPDLPTGDIVPDTFRSYNPLINSSMILKTTEAQWSDRFFGLDDYDLWIRLTNAGHTFYTLPLRLTYHRLYQNSSFNSSNRQDIEGLLSHYYGN